MMSSKTLRGMMGTIQDLSDEELEMLAKEIRKEIRKRERKQAKKEKIDDYRGEIRHLACAYVEVNTVKGWLLQGLEEAGVSRITAYRVLEKAMEDIEDAMKLLEVK